MVIQIEEFTACVARLTKREENDRAWKVLAKDLLKYDSDYNLLSVNLDIEEPRPVGFGLVPASIILQFHCCREIPNIHRPKMDIARHSRSVSGGQHGRLAYLAAALY